MRVLLFDARRQTKALRLELLAAIERVLDSGQYVLGPEVEAFEQDIAQYLGVGHAIGVASGTDALWLALKALGIGPGDRVLTTPFTFFATVSAILNTGAEPVFADIEPDTFNLDPKQVHRVLEGRCAVCQRLGIRPKTVKALVPVHLYGQPADMKDLLALSQKYELFVVEDAAQALGAEYQGRKVGTLGHLGCFSFFPTKNLGAFGDGGLVVTDDDELAERVRLLRAHGSKHKYYHNLIGTNSRLDAVQAAMLRVKLKHLDTWIAARQTHAAGYNHAFQESDGFISPYHAAERTHTYHQYTVRVLEGQRDRLQGFLKEQGVDTAIYYPLPLHLQPVLLYQGYRQGDFPNAEQASSEALSLPIFPEMSREERDYVIGAIEEFLSRGGSLGEDTRA
jgi:dTDP-4-amino-4,6-dideoxygalactose transaminase